MAPSAPATAPQATSKFKQYAVTFSALAIFGAFTGSALAMKIAPLKGLLPGDANKDILDAWKKFAALPQIAMVLKPLKLDPVKFMLAVATLHLVVAMLLVLPIAGKFGSKFAGLWAMVSMIGAEFCTRKTAYVPAGFPKEFKTLGAAIGSGTHLLLFLCGAILLFSKYEGTLVQMLNALLASMKKPKDEKKTEEQRGRSAQSEDKSAKRDSTPKAVKKAESPPSPSKSPRGRPASRGR